MAAEQKRRIGERIRQARLARDWTQGDLARALPGRVEPSQVSRWERGLVQPHPETLGALADALDQDVEFFLVAEPSRNGGGVPSVSLLEALRRDVDDLRARQAEVLERLAALAEEAVENRRELGELREVLRVRRQSG